MQHQCQIVSAKRAPFCQKHLSFSCLLCRCSKHRNLASQCVQYFCQTHSRTTRHRRNHMMPARMPDLRQCVVFREKRQSWSFPRSLDRLKRSLHPQIILFHLKPLFPQVSYNICTAFPLRHRSLRILIEISRHSFQVI